MQNRKLRTVKESEEYWGIPTAKAYPNYLLAKGERREKELVKIAEIQNRGYGSTYSVITNFNDAWLNEQNPWLTNNGLSYRLVTAFKDGEAAAFPYYALNQFIASDEDVSYGEFVEAHWDEILEALESSKLVEDELIEKIFYLDQKSYLLIRPTGRKDTKEVVYALTRAELTKLLTVNDRRKLIAKSGAVETRINTILGKISSEELPKRKAVESALMRSFVKNSAAETDELMNIHEQATADFVSELYRAMKNTYDNPIEMNAGMNSSSQALDFAVWLEANATSLRFYELLALVHALSNPHALAYFPPGSKGSIAELFSKVVKNEDALAIMKLFAETMVLSRTTYPTLEEWEEGLDDGTLGNSISSNLVTTILSSSEKKLRVNKSFNKARHDLSYYLKY